MHSVLAAELKAISVQVAIQFKMKALSVPLLVAILASACLIQASPVNIRLQAGSNKLDGKPGAVKSELQRFRKINTPQQSGKRSLLTSLRAAARKLMSQQGNWVGTDVPAFNAAAMNYYQGYPNRWRAGNAASSMWAAQAGDPSNFGAGYNPYMASGRKLLQSTWVGTDVPSFNAAAMNYYQGYPNRWRAGNAASSMWAAQAGDPSNFGAGYNPYMASGRKLLQSTWVGTDVPSFNAAAMNYYQGYPNRWRAGNAASSMWAAQAGDPSNFGAGYNPYMASGRKLQTSE